MSTCPGFTHLCACVRHRQTVSVWERTYNCDNNHEMTAMIFFPVSQKSSRKQYVIWFKLTTESINFIKCFSFPSENKR